MDLFGVRSMEEFKGVHRGWVTEALEKQGWRNRQPQWTESIAVGSEGFVRETKERLGAKAMWREVVGENGSYELRESLTSYEDDFGPKNVEFKVRKCLLLGHIFLKNNNLAGSDPEARGSARSEAARFFTRR